MRNAARILGIVLAWLANTAFAATPESVVADVDGEKITLAELDAAYRLRPIAAPLSAAQVKQVQAELLEEMIQDRLVRQFFRKHGSPVKAEEVEQHFKALTASLAKQNRTTAEFFRDIGQTEAQARETWTTLIQLSRYVRDRVTEDQLRQYYTANKDHFDRVELGVSHIVLRLGRGSLPGERDHAKRKLLMLREEIVRGTITFAEAARKHSHCPSAHQGGDLGILTRKGGFMDEAFSAAAFAVEVGQISTVIESEMGFHLILVRSRKVGTNSAFDQCGEEVREVFTEDFRIELAKKLRKQASIRISLP